MKFFFRVVTKTAALRLGDASNRSRLKTALVVALAVCCGLGCVGRKQYAINEAILISERRQLEDEIYRLQFELRDALEENERLRQEVGDGSTPASKASAAPSQTRSGTNDAFFPGLDASQTRLRTTGGVQNVPTTSAVDARSARPTTAPALRNNAAPQKADAAPTTGEAIETLPDYVPIPVSSARLGDLRSQTRQTAQAFQTAPTASNADLRAASTNVGKMPGVRRELNDERAVLPVSASTASANGGVVSSVFVDSPSTQEKATVAAPRSNAAAWSPLAQ